MGGLRRFLCALALLFLVAPASQALETKFTGSACPDGVFLVDGKDNLPDSLRQPQSLWGTRCAQGDADTGVARSAPFQLQPHSVVYLSGYPLQEGLGVFLVNLASGETVRLTPAQDPREAWARFDLPMRNEWKGAQVALEMRDDLKGGGGWVGVSAPGEIPMSTRQETLMLAIAAAYALATLAFGAPLLAGFIAFRRLGATAANAGLAATTTTGLMAYAAFWLGVLHPTAAWATAYAVPALSLIALVVALINRPQSPAQTDTLPTIFTLGFLWAIGLVFLATGHLFGPVYWPQVNTNVFEGAFFEQSRPYDDIIPLNFAQEILNPARNLAAPDAGGWHYSDRGPLQTGFVLLAAPISAILGWNATYQAVGTLLQIMSCIGIWIFTRAIGIRPRMSLAILAATVFTPLVYFNALYVWPKMLAGGLCLLSLAILFPPLLRRERLELWPGVCAATLAGLSVLAHGATIFAFIAAGLLMLPGLIRVYPLKPLGAMLAAVAVLMGSWTAYGAFIDPGEDKLTRLHFTGGVDEPGLGIGERIVQSHLRRAPIEWGKDRLSNLATLFGDMQLDRQTIAQLPTLAGQPPATTPPVATPAIDTARLANADGTDALVALLRVDQREFVFRSLAFAGIGLILIFVAWTSRNEATAETRRALRLSLWFTLITTLIWSIAEFYGSRTVVTHAAFGYLYVIAIAALASASLVFSPLVVIACIANIGLLLAVWILPGPGLHLQGVIAQAGLAPALQYAALAILLPALLIAIAASILYIRSTRVPELQPDMAPA